MKNTIFLCLLLLLPLGTLAETPKQEIKIDGDGAVHLVNALLFRRHALNQYTVKSWDFKWSIPIDMTDTKIKFESAYGIAIDLKDIFEGHYLDIEGKLVYNKSLLEYQIEPQLIRDLDIKTGIPPLPTPTSIVATPMPNPAVSAAPASPKASQETAPPTSNTPQPTSKLTMTLKQGYWGRQVKILQEFLKKQGYFPPEEPTSRYFGPLTKKSLAEFQKANALDAVGFVGPKTMAIINSLLGSQ